MRLKWTDLRSFLAQGLQAGQVCKVDSQVRSQNGLLEGEQKNVETTTFIISFAFIYLDDLHSVRILVGAKVLQYPTGGGIVI